MDCPSLTQQGKSSADIHMVLDAVDALAANTRYDEFFIIADDADYTPLVQRLRAADRRVTIVTAGHTASAYRAVADAVVSGDEFVRLLTPGAPNETERAPSVNKARYAAEYEPGQIVMGTVSRIKTYGAFVRLEGGIHGLVHISELAPHFVKSPRQVVAIDDEVRVKIIDIDVDRRQIALSLKQAKEEGDRTSAEADPSPYEVGAEFDKQGSSGHPEGLNPQKTRQRALGLIGAHDANASHPEAPLPSDVAIALRKRRTES